MTSRWLRKLKVSTSCNIEWPQPSAWWSAFWAKLSTTCRKWTHCVWTRLQSLSLPLAKKVTAKSCWTTIATIRVKRIQTKTSSSKEVWINQRSSRELQKPKQPKLSSRTPSPCKTRLAKTKRWVSRRAAIQYTLKKLETIRIQLNWRKPRKSKMKRPLSICKPKQALSSSSKASKIRTLSRKKAHN